MEIKEALSKLDHDDDDAWTGDGLPRIDVIVRMTGVKDIKRQDITDADPKFQRGVIAPEREQETDPAQMTIADLADPDPVADPIDAGTDAIIDPDELTVADLTTEEILAARPQDLTSLEMVNTWLNAANDKLNADHKEVKRLNSEMTMWARRVDIVTRVQTKMNRQQDSNPNGTAISKFLAQQNNARVERAKRASAFLTKGTDAQAVLEQISKGSKLDTAMSQRKAKPGSTRPDPRLPVRK